VDACVAYLDPAASVYAARLIPDVPPARRSDFFWKLQNFRCWLPPAAVFAAKEQSSVGNPHFRHACKMGLEGIVSKRLAAPYRSGPSRDWIKVKNPDSPARARHRKGRWRPSVRLGKHAGCLSAKRAAGRTISLRAGVSVDGNDDAFSHLDRCCVWLATCELRVQPW
jgi:hypothetical protein